MTVQEYIAQHTDICYCEALIYPDGSIEDAHPSHQEALINAADVSRMALMKMMPLEAGPTAWLVDYTGCVALWYKTGLLPESLNAKQIYTISELSKASVIAPEFIGYMQKEMSIIERNRKFRETGEFYDVKPKEIPFYKA